MSNEELLKYESILDDDMTSVIETGNHIFESTELLNQLYKIFNKIDVVNNNDNFKNDFKNVSIRYLISCQDLVDYYDASKVPTIEEKTEALNTFCEDW